MLFLNLAVADVARSRAFYEALGFGVNEHASDDGTVAVVLDDDLALMLRARDRFADLVVGDVGDPASGPTTIPCLTVGDRARVDDVVATAERSGGRPWLPAREDATGYTGSFADPDGHAWQVMSTEPVHVID